MKQMIRGAIFDMDGVLFDTERMYQETWREVALERGITLPEEYTCYVSGASKDGVYEAVRRFYHTDEPVKVTTEVYERMRVKQQNPLPIKPGVKEMLTLLREQEIRTAVASSTFHEQVRYNLENNGLDSFFDTVICGDEVTKAKPDPEIFLKAAQKLSLLPEDCLVFEDSFNGIRAAHAAGCVSVMVIDLMEPDKAIRAIADHVFSDLLEARVLIPQNHPQERCL